MFYFVIARKKMSVKGLSEIKEAAVVASFFRLMASWHHSLVADTLKVLPP